MKKCKCCGQRLRSTLSRDARALRAAEITARHMAGEKAIALADEYGISVQYVYMLASAAKEAA